jgi:hypothetical protein
MMTYGPFEHVLLETEWFDGPRAGIANVHGEPHRFLSLFDEGDDEYLGSFLVWPVGAEELALEQEQWLIFVAWNDRYEAGEVDIDTHPGHRGTNQRWDELTLLLEPARKAVPANARRAKANRIDLGERKRYERIGPAYQLSWALL